MTESTWGNCVGEGGIKQGTPIAVVAVWFPSVVSYLWECVSLGVGMCKAQHAKVRMQFRLSGVDLNALLLHCGGKVMENLTGAFVGCVSDQSIIDKHMDTVGACTKMPMQESYDQIQAKKGLQKGGSPIVPPPHTLKSPPFTIPPPCIILTFLPIRGGCVVLSCSLSAGAPC